MCVGVPREAPGETRVALVPSVVPRLREASLRVVVEAGAGHAAGFADETYVEHGAEIGTRADAFAADIVVQVRTCGATRVASGLERLRPDQVVVGIADAVDSPGDIRRAASR